MLTSSSVVIGEGALDWHPGQVYFHFPREPLVEIISLHPLIQTTLLPPIIVGLFPTKVKWPKSWLEKTGKRVWTSEDVMVCPMTCIKGKVVATHFKTSWQSGPE